MHKIRSILISLALLATSLPLLAGSLIQPRIVGGVESDPNAWPYMTALMSKVLSVTVAERSYQASYLRGSPLTLFAGRLVDCGLASEPCAGVRGNICLIQRGNNTFAEKVRNCEAGGGIGAIIYNNVSGTFLGTLQNAVTGIPAVSVSDEAGAALRGAIGKVASFGYSDLITPTESFCGATWIGDVWVLTAAHCVSDTEPEAIMVNVGGHDLRRDQENVIAVTEVLVHERYDPDGINNDIALLRLERAPQGVTPIAIAPDQLLDAAIRVGAPGYMLGRGQQEPVAPGDPAPATPVEYALFEVAVPLVSNEVCARAMEQILGTHEPSPVTDAMVCAGRPEGNVGTCFGDSGGPMIIFDGSTPYLGGITSWGIGCAQPGLYDVMTRVPYFKADIDKTITAQARSTDSNNDFGDDTATTSGKKDKRFGIGGFSPLLLMALGWLRRRRLATAVRVVTLACLPVLALAGCQLTAGNLNTHQSSNMKNLETLRAIDISRDGVEITVISTGCTATGDFQLVLTPHQDLVELAVYRTRPDLCRRAPRPLTLLLPWRDDAQFPEQTVRILNPVSPAVAK